MRCLRSNQLLLREHAANPPHFLGELPLRPATCSVKPLAYGDSRRQPHVGLRILFGNISALPQSQFGVADERVDESDWKHLCVSLLLKDLDAENGK